VRTLLAALVAAVLTLSGLAVLSVSWATPAAALDNGLALTPPMGWNDWNAFGCNVSAQLVEQTAQAMVADGMKAAGYQYVNIDDCWAEPATGATLGFLATATYGPASGTGTISYSDGTTQPFALTVPDWYAAPPSGSDPAITMTYRNRSGNVQQAHQINVYYLTVPLQAGKTVTAVTLPAVGGTAVSGSPAMHIFAVAVS